MVKSKFTGHYAASFKTNQQASGILSACIIDGSV
jgi:hypothetical protein